MTASDGDTMLNAPVVYFIDTGSLKVLTLNYIQTIASKNILAQDNKAKKEKKANRKKKPSRSFKPGLE